MSPVRKLLGFSCRLGLILGLLIVPWPGLNGWYARGFRATGNFLFGSFWAKGLVKFQSHPQADGDLMDTDVMVANRETLRPDGSALATYYSFNCRHIGYVPTVMVIAVILSTPVSWRRRAWALCWGMLLVHVFLGFLLAIMLLTLAASHEWLGLFPFNSFWRKVVFGLNKIFIFYEGARLSVPVFIWMVVAFRREDWVKNIGEGTGSNRKLQKGQFIMRRARPK